MKFKLRNILLAVFLAGATAQDTAGEELKLWYAQPATKWTEALPVGNGRMGAMIFGGVPEERIQFNEDTLWRGKPHDYVRAGAGDQLAEIRRLLAEGKTRDAEKLAKEKFLSDPVRQKPYQPFGDLHLQFPGHTNFTDYRRELDLDSAIATTTYRVDEVSYRREVFASYPDRAIVIRITADHHKAVNFTLSIDSPHTNSQVKPELPPGDPRCAFSQPLFLPKFLQSAKVRGEPLNSGKLTLSGKVQDDGLSFVAQARVLVTDGEVHYGFGTLSVKNADSATILLVAATSFKNFEDISADPAKRSAAELAKISKRKYDDILKDHLADYRKLFRRVSFDLGETNLSAAPTDQRLALIKTNGIESDSDLAALHYQFGRYLLIASSRPGSQPANLQGVWNAELNPPWESKYTLNINCEMNYWLAEPCNLSECHEPLFDMIDDLVISGARTAKKQYGARGWVAHHNTDLWRGTAPINNIDGIWPTGGAWLCQHLWEHYLFTGDKKFLAHAYPALKSASKFFMDFLVKDPKTGWLVSTPSFSPEQGSLCIGPTMDHQIIRALMSYTIQAADVLGKDRKFAAELARIRSQIAPDQIGKHGQLQEWLEDVDVPNNNHRHMSPLFALYPGEEITPASTNLFAAAKVLLQWRGDGSTGWSYAWRMPLWARVGDGDFALRQYNGLLGKRTLPNLFDLCGPFQIDGNFGATAGVTEMLLQSHQTEARNGRGDMRVIDLLPALPKAWPTGSISGLRARGGFEIDFSWENGVLKKAMLHSSSGNSCIVRCNGRVIELQTKKGQQYAFDGELKLITAK